MRKISREMPAEWALSEVFAKAPYVTVSMVTADGEPYAVPLSLAMTDDKTFYFHCATDGKKNDIFASKPSVWLSAVSKCKPMVGPKDDSFTLEFRSAMAKGVVEPVTDRDEQIRGLRAISERFLPKHMSAFDAAVERSLSHTLVYRITLIESPTGKRKQYDANGDEMKYARMK
jgi:nitroimidazol reductase NimA-like FMN-containing flavoprotein (pyridoxamine 5'-phosphate oxidase superfamily)